MRLLKKDINRILANGPGLKTRKTDAQRASEILPCDLCGAAFTWIGSNEDLDNADSSRDCPDCAEKPQSIADIERDLNKLPNFISRRLTDIMALPPEEAAEQFGKFCSVMISKKEIGTVVGKVDEFNWNTYSNAIGRVARFLTERRLNK